ncbi:anhydro-N-acetylmuramic acid kinase [Chromohalobacter japonicus]|uniref:anhydro-N-acetylmuramic acid kinase n=1 Tax=Chromohalobacter japonicus TaxID=223900 RepID=UPI001FF14380|nr:anhydro-N-acetylmuramic acid kinase [Chromohalobacter japonicus]MCK0752385.1 anhydro-N-acetylmuramic acid kinase [Chromohalobacter japonicus]
MPLYIGLMSGTSLDGIDAALVRCGEGRPEWLGATGAAFPATLREDLLALCLARDTSFGELARLETAFCERQAEAVNRLLTETDTSPSDIAAIGSHGQTIEHAPDATPPHTYQLDNPSLLAELTGCAVVGDFRRRDMAAGGQAAPLAPAFHAALFTSPEHTRLILNLGGIANLTRIPPSDDSAPVLGFDTGPANMLMDAWCQRHLGHAYDADGAWAASGRVDEALLARLLDDPYFRRSPPKSTGRERFHLDWLATHLTGNEAPRDVQATLAELTAASIAMAITQGEEHADGNCDALIPCGGGAHNADLLARLRRHVPEIPLTPCERFGWSADWLEAGAFAWLAHQRLVERPGNLPEVTGARGPRVLGGLYAP